MIKVQAAGLDTAIMKLRVARSQLSGGLMSEALGEIGRKGADALRGYVPSKTGRTRQAVTFVVAGNEVSIGLGQTVPAGLGKWLVEGTGPHDIQGSPLLFQKGGESIYRQGARHPGTKPMDMAAASSAVNDIADAVVSAQALRLGLQLND